MVGLILFLWLAGSQAALRDRAGLNSVTSWGRRIISSAMKRIPESLERTVNRNSPEYVTMIRQIWKESHSRTPASVEKALKVKKEKAKKIRVT
jgi:hypothetical protein